MSAKEFFDAVTHELGKTEMDFQTNQQFEEAIRKKKEERKHEEEEKKKSLLGIVDNIETKMVIKVPNLPADALTINLDALISDMEKTMILHSHIIDDIFNLQNALDDTKVVQNSLVCLLHHNLKHNNNYKLKSHKELETYLVSDYYYNKVNIIVKRLQSQILKSNNYSDLIEKKLGFLKEVSQNKRAQLYKESRSDG